MENTALFVEKLPAWYSPDGGSNKQNTKELHSIVRYANAVQGWLSEQQGIALYQMAQWPVPGSVLEIGSFCGKSTIFIALGCKHNPATFYAVDPHKPISKGGKEQYAPNFQPYEGDSLAEIQKTIKNCGLSDQVTLVVASSEEAAQQLKTLSLKLLFIDGSHDYADVLLDYNLWHEMVVVGGHLVFHDSNFEGVKNLIHDQLDHNRYVHEGTVGDGGWAMTIWRRIT